MDLLKSKIGHHKMNATANSALEVMLLTVLANTQARMTFSEQQELQGYFEKRDMDAALIFLEKKYSKKEWEELILQKVLPATDNFLHSSWDM